MFGNYEFRKTQLSIVDTDFMSDAGMTTDASEVPTRITPPTTTTQLQEEHPRRRRTRPPRVEVPDHTSGHESETTNGNLTDSSIQSERRGRESMAERMQRRRKSQVSMEEIQNNLSKIESLRQRSRDESENDVKQSQKEEHRERRVRDTHSVFKFLFRFLRRHVL